MEADKILSILLLIVIVIVILQGYLITELKSKHKQELEKARLDAIKRSKTVIRASVSEEMVPLFEGFPYQIGDCKLFSKPVDFVVFDGMNEFRDGNKEKEITIVLADVKTGKAVKTPVQRKIMEAIDAGRIRFEEWRIDEQNKFSIK